MVISNRELGFGGNMSDIIASESTNYDLNEVVASLNRLLKLRTIPIGMKMFESIEEMESIPKIRRPSACLLYTSPSPRDYAASRMPSSA